MYFLLFLKGLLIGFTIAAPVGPIGILCIRRTLAEGRLSGFFTGLGAASADGIYGLVAGFGLTFISNFLLGQRIFIQLIGGVFLCYMGFKTFLSQPSGDELQTESSSLLSNYLSTFFLTLTNPMTILSFLAIIASLGLPPSQGLSAPASFVLGVFSGSALWWFILSGFMSLYRTKIKTHQLRWVNQVSGLIILVFGFVALWNAIS